MIKHSSQGLWLVLIAALAGVPSQLASERAIAADVKPISAKTTDEKADTKPAAAKDATFDDIKLDIKAGDKWDKKLLTEKVKKLDGKQVRIRGYIFPSFQQTGIKRFVLVRDNLECCFGPMAALHDCIDVEMAGEATATFTVVPVTVEGTFKLKELVIDGKTLAIYHLDGTAVK